VTRLTDRQLRRLAWAGWWFVVAASASRLLTSTLAPVAPTWGGGLLTEYAFTTVVLSFPLVGLVVLLRQPRNRVGWLLEGVGLAWTLPEPLDAYAHHGLVTSPGSVPGPEVAAALTEGTWVWGVLMMGVYLILLFPDGHLPSSRWRVLAWLAGAAALVLPVGIAMAPGALEEAPVAGLDNPLAVPALSIPAIVASAVFLPLVPLCIVAAAASLAMRFRGSHGVQREQVTWLAAAGTVVALLYAVTLATTLGSELLGDGRTETTGAVTRLLQEASLVSFLLLPLAIGTAILRHRLFDIDLVINRALVYGTLTATLAGLYLGSVLLLQLLLRPVTLESDLAVAVSTLAVAAVFGPARRWIQSAVDRRFYRRRYDAALALAAFTGRLQHQVDLDAVGGELLDAVRETVQPTHATVWLPGTEGRP
jgi:hypothetical protein